MKFTVKNILVTAALFALCVTAAQAQFASYNSFVNGFNFQATAPTAAVLTTNSFGATNVDSAFGINAYVYPGTYPITSNNAYIGTNTVITGTSAFGYQTNTGVLVDARLWPDNNSDTSTSEALFISVAGLNNTATNSFLLTFAPVVDVPITVPPPSPNLAVFPGYTGSGTITNAVAMTQAQNLFAVAITANGLTPVNVLTNPPTAFLNGAHKARLLSIASTTTNTVAGIATNSYYSSVLTNGVWQIQTNSFTVTNWGGVYLNAGVCGYPPFHSP